MAENRQYDHEYKATANAEKFMKVVRKYTSFE